MAVVRRIFYELASGASVNGNCAALDADGVPPPAKGKNNWQRTFVRDCPSTTSTRHIPWKSLRPSAFRGRRSGSSIRLGSTGCGGTTAGRLRPCAYHSGAGATARGSRSARSPGTSGYLFPSQPREREELRAKLDALSRQKRAAQEGTRALEERRSRVRELKLSREKIRARYIEVAHEELEKADGNKRSAVYNTLGVTVWAARTREDPIRIEMSALGGEKVCHNDATSTR